MKTALAILKRVFGYPPRLVAVSDSGRKRWAVYSGSHRDSRTWGRNAIIYKNDRLFGKAYPWLWAKLPATVAVRLLNCRFVGEHRRRNGTGQRVLSKKWSAC